MSSQGNRRRSIGSATVDALERWKRGFVFLLCNCLLMSGAFLAAGVPMKIISEVADNAAWASLQNIALVAALGIFPLFASNSAVVRAFRQVFDD